MKKLLILFTMFTWAAFCRGQNSKEEAFATTVREVVLKLSKRDSSGLSRFIDRKTGIYILEVIGVKETYQHFMTVGFSDDSYPRAPFYDKVRFSSLTYASLPAYDCGAGWSKKGVYVDTGKVDHMVSRMLKWNNKHLGDAVPQQTISKFFALESISRRIVVATSNDNWPIIYLSYINNKWVLTIIDKATGDCSV